MAMIKCIECGKEMSDRAKICPNCGFQNDIICCPECNKQLSSKATICPNCGCPINEKQNMTSKKVNTFSLSGMIVGIVSFFIDFFGLVAVVGFVVSIIGLNKSSNKKDKRYAIIGIVCSCIELILKFIQLVTLANL